jgi:hypothetical protein
MLPANPVINMKASGIPQTPARINSHLGAVDSDEPNTNPTVMATIHRNKDEKPPRMRMKRRNRKRRLV